MFCKLKSDREKGNRPLASVAKRKIDAKTMKRVALGTDNTYRVYTVGRNRVRCACDVNFNGTVLFILRRYIVAIGWASIEDEENDENETQQKVQVLL